MGAAMSVNVVGDLDDAGVLLRSCDAAFFAAAFFAAVSAGD